MLFALKIVGRLKHLTKRCSSWEACRYLATLPIDNGRLSEEEQAVGRQWLGTFEQSKVPRDSCEVSFSRASGPGGQKVNK